MSHSFGPVVLDALDDDGRGHAAGSAHGHEPALRTFGIVGTTLVTGIFSNVGTANFSGNAFNVTSIVNVVGTTNITGFITNVGSAILTGGTWRHLDAEALEAALFSVL